MKTSEILARLSFPVSLKNSKYTMNSIIRLYLYRLIRGIKNYEAVIKELSENESDAFILGFFKDGNNRLMLPPKRTFNHLLKNVDRDELDRTAEKILKEASDNKVILEDIEIVKKVLKKKKNYDKEKREIIKLVKKLVYPNIDLKIHHNAKFTLKDFLDVLVHVGLTHDFTNNGSETFREINDIDSPSGDLMMHHFSKFKSVDELQNIFDKILDTVFEFSKKEYNLLKRRKFDIAYDVHEICYYGRPMPFVCGGKFKDGTSKFFKFLTCSIVLPGRRFILDVIPINQLNQLHKLLDKSLEKVKKKIHIERVYLDRYFCNINIIKTLNSHKVKFLMPHDRNNRVKNWFDKSEGCKSRVIEDFIIGNKKRYVEVNLILVDDEDGIKRAFCCNFDISPIIAYKLYFLYSRRWGIEISYRSLKHDFRARTTTRNPYIRMFYFFFSSCLFNLWVLTNICLGLMIYGRVKNKPIITTKMFAMVLYRIQEGYVDWG